MTDTEKKIILNLESTCMALREVYWVLTDLIDSHDARIKSMIRWVEDAESSIASLLDDMEASTPSSDDKSPTAATGESNSGTQEAIEVGDLVRTRGASMQGVVLEVGTDGIIDLRTESGSRFYREPEKLEIVKKGYRKP